MAASPYSQPVKPASFQDPLDLNLFLKGESYKEGLAKDNLQLIGNAINTFSSIPAFGVDAEQLNSEVEGLKSQLTNMNISNLGDINTISQLNKVVSDAKNNPRLMSIARRGNAYSQELAKKQKAEEKGESYISPILDQAEEYYSNGAFSDKVSFNGSGWVAPDKAKVIKLARENSKKKVLNPSTGQVTEVIDPQEVGKNYQMLTQSDPRFRKTDEYEFQKNTKGIDWNSQGQNYINQQIELLRQEGINARLNNNPEGEQAALSQINRLSKLANPNLIGNELRDKYFQSYQEQEIEKVGLANDLVSFEKFERDPVYMENLRTQNNILEARQKMFLDAGIDPITKQPITVNGKPLSELKEKQAKEYKPTDKQLFAQRVINNKQVTQADLNEMADTGETLELVPDKNGDGYLVRRTIGESFTNPKGEVEYTKGEPVLYKLEEIVEGKLNTKLPFVFKQSKKEGKPSSGGDEFEEFKRKN